MFNQKLVGAEAHGVVERYVLVADIQCVLGVSQHAFPTEGRLPLSGPLG